MDDVEDICHWTVKNESCGYCGYGDTRFFYPSTNREPFRGKQICLGGEFLWLSDIRSQLPYS